MDIPLRNREIPSVIFFGASMVLLLCSWPVQVLNDSKYLVLALLSFIIFSFNGSSTFPAISRDRLAYALGVFVAYMIISTLIFYAIGLTISFIYPIIFLNYYLFYLAFTSLLKCSEHVSKVFRYVLPCCLIIQTVFFLFYLLWGTNEQFSFNSFTGSNKNYFTLNYVLLIFFYDSIGIRSLNSKFLYVLFNGIAVLLLVTSQAKVCIVFYLYFLMLKTWNNEMSKMVRLALFTISIFGLVLIFNFGNASFELRTSLFHPLFQLLSDSPVSFLFGYGSGSWSTVTHSKLFYTLDWYNMPAGFNWLRAHNIALKLILEFGIVGLLLYSIYVVNVINKVFIKRRFILLVLYILVTSMIYSDAISRFLHMSTTDFLFTILSALLSIEDE